MKGFEMPHFSPRTARVLKWILIAGVAIVILIPVAGSVLSGYITRKAESKFEEAGGKFGDLDVNLFTKSISIQNIEFTKNSDSDSVVATVVHIKNIALKNISIYQLIVNQALSMGDVLVTQGDITINRAITPEDTSKTQKEAALTGVYIERVKFTDVHLSVVSDSSKEYSGVINATLTGVKSSDTASVTDLNAYNLEEIDIDIAHLLISTPKLYSIKIASVNASSHNNKLVVDSLQLIPKYTKFNFAEVAGKQTDRINTFIPKLEIDGLQYNMVRDSSFVASKIKITSLDLNSFRDKRQPFRETKVKPLPIAALKSLNFKIRIDTIEINDSRIEYEEFAPEGFAGGTVVFEDLNAILTNLSNNSDGSEPNHATLKASAKLMGQGQIDATFRLPFDDDEEYHAEGKIGKMALDHLNPALQNLAFIRVQSGTLEGLVFNFNYNDKVSNGKVTINYQDLKIEGLKKEKSPVINDLKTLLINTVLKNNKDKDVPLEKRTGIVEFERDRQRQIFNYWWKSLFSGIKSGVME